MKSIKLFLRRTALYDIVCAYRDWSLVWRWMQEGCSSTPPGIVKRSVLLHYYKKYKPMYFVETGTFFAETTRVMRKYFDVVFSIELNRELHQQAKYVLGRHRNVILVNGDSKNELPAILAKITAPALFWLDAHYSGGVTSKSEEFTPIKSELLYIFNHPVDGHIVLIDDARLFNGEDDYPDMAEVEEMVRKYKSTYHFKVENDIIQIFP
nr:hypothetical protein [Nitrospirota bacterium]